jgi:cyclohexa-1,5-dienecarbonyl-CoA hydratase
MSAAVRHAVEEGGQVVRLTLDGGPGAKGNLLDRPLLASLRTALADAAAPAVKAVLIEGAGDHFSFGASVDEHRPEKVAAFLSEFHELFRWLAATPQARIAVVRGQCLGGGLELALSCQRIVAAPGAKLGLPELKLGVFAPVASLLLPRRIGQAAAEDLLLSGRSVGAEEAARLGLVDEVAEEPLEAARAWARTHLLALSASSLRFAAAAARAELSAALPERLAALERLYLEELMATRDAVEGIAAFLEKRPARFAGSSDATTPGTPGVAPRGASP